MASIQKYVVSNACLGTDDAGLIFDQDITTQKKDDLFIYLYGPKYASMDHVAPFQTPPGLVINKQMTVSKTSILQDRLVVFVAFDITHTKNDFPPDVKVKQIIDINHTFIGKLKKALFYCYDMMMWKEDIDVSNFLFPIYEEGHVLAFSTKRWKCILQDPDASAFEKKRIRSFKTRDKMEKAMIKSKLWVDQSYLSTHLHPNIPNATGPTNFNPGDMVILNFWIRGITKRDQRYALLELVFDAQNILIRPKELDLSQ